MLDLDTRRAHRCSWRPGPMQALVLLAALWMIGVAGASATAPPWETIAPGGDTICATGTPYSFHVRSGDPERLMIFFNGGGACWTGDQCDIASEPTPYVPFAQSPHNDPRTHGGAFALDNPANPFRDWTQLFVSYCTGDVHLGTRDASYATSAGHDVLVHHQGRRNAGAALEWAYRSLPAPATVFVSGGSAGAVASPFYAAVVAEHWPDADVIQFGGGSGAYRAPGTSALMEAWGVFDGLPDWPEFADFAPPEANFEALYVIAAEHDPSIRLSRFDTAYDAVQESFMRLLGAAGPLYAPLFANRADLHRRASGVRSFIAGGTEHTLLRYDRLYTYQADGVPVLDWLNALIRGDALQDIDCGSAETCMAAPQ